MTKGKFDGAPGGNDVGEWPVGIFGMGVDGSLLSPSIIAGAREVGLISEYKLGEAKVAVTSFRPEAYGDGRPCQDGFVLSSDGGFAVVDGMGGGFGSGYKAAKKATQVIGESFLRQGNAKDMDDAERIVRQVFNDLVSEGIDGRKAGIEGLGGGEAVGSVCMVVEDTLIAGTCGDTRVLIVSKDGSVSSVTKDSSNGNVVGKVLGNRLTEVSRVQINPGDKIILASDGIFGDWDGQEVNDIDYGLQKKEYQFWKDDPEHPASDPSAPSIAAIAGMEPVEAVDYLVRNSRKDDDKTVIVIEPDADDWYTRGPYGSYMAELPKAGGAVVSAAETSKDIDDREIEPKPPLKEANYDKALKVELGLIYSDEMDPKDISQEQLNRAVEIKIERDFGGDKGKYDEWLKAWIVETFDADSFEVVEEIAEPVSSAEDDVIVDPSEPWMSDKLLKFLERTTTTEAEEDEKLDKMDDAFMIVLGLDPKSASNEDVEIAISEEINNRFGGNATKFNQWAQGLEWYTGSKDEPGGGTFDFIEEEAEYRKKSSEKIAAGRRQLSYVAAGNAGLIAGVTDKFMDSFNPTSNSILTGLGVAGGLSGAVALKRLFDGHKIDAVFNGLNKLKARHFGAIAAGLTFAGIEAGRTVVDTISHSLAVAGSVGIGTSMYALAKVGEKFEAASDEEKVLYKRRAAILGAVGFAGLAAASYKYGWIPGFGGKSGDTTILDSASTTTSRPRGGSSSTSIVEQLTPSTQVPRTTVPSVSGSGSAFSDLGNSMPSGKLGLNVFDLADFKASSRPGLISRIQELHPDLGIDKASKVADRVLNVQADTLGAPGADQKFKAMIENGQVAADNMFEQEIAKQIATI